MRTMGLLLRLSRRTGSDFSAERRLSIGSRLDGQMNLRSGTSGYIPTECLQPPEFVRLYVLAASRERVVHNETSRRIGWKGKPFVSTTGMPDSTNV